MSPLQSQTRGEIQANRWSDRLQTSQQTTLFDGKTESEQMWNASKSTSCSDLRQAHVSNLNQGVCFLMNSLGDNFIVCLLQLVYKLSNCPTAHYCAIYDLFLVMSLHF